MGTKTCLCAICSSQQKTCCQERDIYLTPGDVKRIKECIHNESFYEFRIPSDPSYLEIDDDPVWKECVFRSDRTRRVLKQAPFRNCIFLSASGCILRIEERPLICRLHPYDYDASGLNNTLIQECPVHLIEPGTTVEEAIGLNLTLASDWHHMLYSEILLEKLNNENRTDI